MLHSLQKLLEEVSKIFGVIDPWKSLLYTCRYLFKADVDGKGTESKEWLLTTEGSLEKIITQKHANFFNCDLHIRIEEADTQSSAFMKIDRGLAFAEKGQQKSSFADLDSLL